MQPMNYLNKGWKQEVMLFTLPPVRQFMHKRFRAIDFIQRF
jgi:hypothetical protein